MLRNTWTLAIILASAIPVTGVALPQNAQEPLQGLVETSARRLLIAKEVALAKWDQGAPVEDAPREEKVIASAVKGGAAVGLKPASVESFFRAQIEANKVVQYALLADWHRSGTAPAHAPINLVVTIRPQLDQLQTALIADLKDTAAVRASATCPIEVAKAVGKYAMAHKHDLGPLEEIALDRALAAACS
jgi:chorismate mutase